MESITWPLGHVADMGDVTPAPPGSGPKRPGISSTWRGVNDEEEKGRVNDK